MPQKPKDALDFIENGCGRCEFGGTSRCKVRPWQEELNLLRGVVLKSNLTEEIKWGAPCYSLKGKNILMLSALKDSVVISFFNGSRIDDPISILEKPGDQSRFARYIKFNEKMKIMDSRDVIRELIEKAIEIESNGSTKLIEDVQLEYPPELMEFFVENKDLQNAFSSLTPGRKRGYLIHFSSAKQSKTRIARIEKCSAKILQGKGWNER